MKSVMHKIFISAIVLLLLSIASVNAQIYPVELEERIDGSTTAIIGTVSEKVSYWDVEGKNIYTLHIVEVTAFAKGPKYGVEQIGVITEGGIVGNKMERTFPGVNMALGEEVFVLLTADEQSIDNRTVRMQYPDLEQCRPVFGVQGILKYQSGKYIDRIAEDPMSEVELLERVEKTTRQKSERPDGSAYRARPAEVLSDSPKIILGLNNGAGTNPSSYVSGTIEENNELIITGSGFGGSIGTIVFSDADAGGSSEYVVPLNSIDSDIVSWSDTEVRLKIPTEAGTGTVEVKDVAGTSIGSAAIAVDYGINNVASDFYNWAGDHRNRLEMVDMDGQGGYTFEYNNNAPSAMNSMYGNSAAQDAFERALETWRCSTGVNFDFDDSGTSEGHAGDNGNIIIFQSISGGTLGVTTTRYSALANGACSMENTLWYLEEIDIRFNSNLTGGFSWNYGPGGASGSQFDFESTAVHELGHAHGLGHIVSPGKVMHYTLSNGAEIRSLSSEDIAAGTFKVAHSTQSNCISTPEPMIAVPAIDCALLPVELLNFKAYQVESSVVLDWETVHEHENDHFSIERSADGKAYETIGEVTGAGFSTSLITYEFIDREPLAGINYYRLKQTDFDGHSSYSPVRTITFERPSTGIDIFPNPATTDQIDIMIGLEKKGISTIQFSDSAGKQFVVDMESTALGYRASIGHLAPGVYFVTMVSDQGNPLIRKFVKQ